MEVRMRKHGCQASPEQPRPWPEPPPSKKLQQQQHARRVPVVYYLSKGHHLEHPHFIEVPVSSSDGLYLRDVITRLVVLRGKRMPAMYSWSCKRSYKNGFVWHDLSEDDLIFPAHGNEYVLKGTELLDRTPTDRYQHCMRQSQQETHAVNRRQEPCSPSSSPVVSTKGAKSPPRPPSPTYQEDNKVSSIPCQAESSGNASPEPGISPLPSSENGCSPSLLEYRVRKPKSSMDASTQTDDIVRRKPAANKTLDIELDETRSKQSRRSSEMSETGKNVIYPPLVASSPSSSNGKTDTLESLIRAEGRKVNNFRILEEEEIILPTRAKLKAANLVMQLITCGAVSVKGHRNFGFIPTYKPSFSDTNFSSPMFTGSVVIGELDGASEDFKSRGRRRSKDNFSGSLLETTKHKKEAGGGIPTLRRSSSCNESRTCKSPSLKEDEEELIDSPLSKCLARTFGVTTFKPSRHATLVSPTSDAPRKSSESGHDHSRSLGSSHGGSNRITDSSSVRGSSIRLESFQEGQDKAYFRGASYNPIYSPSK